MIATIDRRSVMNEPVEYREAADGGPMAVGYAAVFNRRSLDLGGFTETVDADAFNKTVQEADVLGLWNHNERDLLGRISSGTLRLTVDARGLAYEIDLPGTTTGRDVAELLKRKDIKGSSFGFRTIRDEWHVDDNGVVSRTLLEVALIDVSPVTRPAYPDTEAALRSLAAKTHHDVAELEAAIEQRKLGSLIFPADPPEGDEKETQDDGDEDGRSETTVALRPTWFMY